MSLLHKVPAKNGQKMAKKAKNGKKKLAQKFQFLFLGGGAKKHQKTNKC